MIRTLRHAALRTGERLRIAALTAPAGRYAGAIRKFLGHKGQPWLLHVDLANQGKVDALRTTYTIGLLGREIVGNVMVVNDGRVGILGHVFTAPDHRRKGICQELMAAALHGFRGRGGRVLTLGTGYDSPPYWIYHGFGFRAVEPDNGHMLLECRAGALARYFAPASARAVEARWQHWPGISLLFMQQAGDAIRSRAYDVIGPTGFEGGFLRFQAQRERLAAQARVLLTRAGAVAGAAILQRDPRWPGNIWCLDHFVHPSFQGREPTLLGSLDFPRGAKVQAVLDHPSASRAQALRGAGLRLEARLRRQLERGGRRSDVLVYALHS